MEYLMDGYTGFMPVSDVGVLGLVYLIAIVGMVIFKLKITNPNDKDDK